MHYQPIVDLGDGRTLYFESLIRVLSNGEWISPGEIFPVVEARRLEVELDRAIIDAIAEDLRLGRVPPDTGVSINLSGPTVVEEDVTEWLAGLVGFMDRYRFVLEVTETALITQMDKATENLQALRKMGFAIALDDFGSGYSSVRYLADMPVDIVKFDISLIRALAEDKQSVIVSHLAEMILHSGHKLVAEGIEDEQALQRVSEIGFHCAQGYYFGKPSRDELVETNVVPLRAKSGLRSQHSG